MPTSACAPWLSAARAPCARLWSPYERGSRGASCGRAATVGRCVSRATPGSILRSERPASGSAIPGLIGCCARSSQSIPREFRDSAEPTGHRRLRLPTMPRVPRSSRVSQKSDNHQLSPQCGCQSPPRGVLTFRFCSAAIQRIEYPSFCISRIIGSSCFARSRAPPRIWEEHPVFIEEKSRFGGFPLPGYLEPHRKLLSASYAAPSYRS